MKVPMKAKLLCERASKSIVFNKILKGGAWMAAGTMVAQVLGLATSVLLARLLGVQSADRSMAAIPELLPAQ